jgi:hypothetical protein
MNPDIRREYKYHIKDLRKIINSWELIPGAPNDEFDALNIKLLSHLGRGAEREKLERFIFNELITYYGLDIEQDLSKELAAEVYEWWNDKR